MTEFETVNAATSGEPKRDRYGRYLLPNPETGEEQPWTRATTISNTLKDRYAVEKWDNCNIVWGMGKRPDLFARAAASKRDDNSTLRGIVKSAKEAASAQSAANVGSAIHQFAERVDAGEDVDIPAPYHLDVMAYRETMIESGMEIVMIERIVCLPEVGVAGTFDRLVSHPDWGLPRILDIKTASDGIDYEGRPYNKILSYGMVDIPIQLAIYAHGSYWWDGDRWVTMPEVDQERAVVIHVPAGQKECRLYEVDIAEGWRVALPLAVGTREWRKRKDLATVIDLDEASSGARHARKDDEGCVNQPEDSPAPNPADESGVSAEGSPRSPAPSLLCSECTTDDDPIAWCDCESGAVCKGPCKNRAHSPERCPVLAWLRERVENIKTHPQARARLASLWKLSEPPVPTFPNGGPRTDGEVDLIVGACALVEMEFQLPFPDEDPTDPAPTKEQRKIKDNPQA